MAHIYIDNTSLLKNSTALKKKVDDSVVTDAVLSATLYAPAGTAVTGCSGISMTHLGSGYYYCEMTPSTSLTENAVYTMVVTCSNYTAKWEEPFTAIKRPFDE